MLMMGYGLNIICIIKYGYVLPLHLLMLMWRSLNLKLVNRYYSFGPLMGLCLRLEHYPLVQLFLRVFFSVWLRPYRFPVRHFQACEFSTFVITYVSTKRTPTMRVNLQFFGKIIYKMAIKHFWHTKDESLFLWIKRITYFTCKLLITSASFGKSLTSSTRFRFIFFEKT